jgi:hypothetical protein
MLRHNAWLLLIAVLASSGCNGGDSAPSDGPSEMERMATQLAQEEKDANAKADADAAAQAATPPPVPEEEPMSLIESSKREETYNPLLAAAHAYVFAGDTATNLQHKSAINFFYGENGRYPKSNEEYMKRIVDAGLVILPKPDEGKEFWYNPKDPTNIWVRSVGSNVEEAEPPK